VRTQEYVDLISQIRVEAFSKTNLIDFIQLAYKQKRFSLLHYKKIVDEENWTLLNKRSYQYLKNREFSNDELFGLLVAHSSIFHKTTEHDFFGEVKSIIADP
jgi:hypothetical protein